MRAVPLFGGILADSVLGKFLTIMLLSIVYCLGNVLLAFSAVPGATGSPPSEFAVLSAVALIAIGTGGIKPCVSSFGGDQFTAAQSALVAGFFSAFYFAINTGSALSMLITPALRERVTCFGRSDCFPLAFAVPALFMILATVVIAAGRRRYRVTPLSPNVAWRVTKLVAYAARAKWRGERPTQLAGASPAEPADWLSLAAPAYDRSLISDTRRLLRVLVLFTPIPAFWAIFDQQSSRWTIQATRMNGHGIVAPDQMQALNAALILCFIPLFEKFVYPAIERAGFRFTSLRRIGAGMVGCALCFVVAALVQLPIEATCCAKASNANLALMQKNRNALVDGCALRTCVSMFWQVPQYVVLTAAEVMLSISGLEFAYSEAPPSLKSLVSSAWLLTVAVGNLLVVVVAEARFVRSAAGEYLCFAAFVLCTFAVYLWLARRYVPLAVRRVIELEWHADASDGSDGVALLDTASGNGEATMHAGA